MKKLLVIALMFSLTQAFAQSVSIFEATSATTLSPFATATKLTDAATVSTLAPTITSIASEMNGRGVAGKEQLKDDLVVLNDDMIAGKVRSISDIRQPALKELFSEIAANEEHMENINSAVVEGSELHKIATAVVLTLLSE